MKSPRNAFTLIELLIVIAILGILMALLFPVVATAIDNARRTQAKNDVTQIATAIAAYEVEYGRLPLPTSTEVDQALLALLNGSSNANNPRQITFMEFLPAKRGKSGTNADGFVDPWGVVYQIKMDEDYDNHVKSVGWGSNAVPDLHKKVAVWNDPDGQSNRTDAQKKRSSVNSWD